MTLRCLRINTNVIEAKADDALVGVLTWADQSDGSLYIPFLWVDISQPSALVRMMIIFRKLHHGKIVRFEHIPDNPQMRRMAELLDAVPYLDGVWEVVMP